MYRLALLSLICIMTSWNMSLINPPEKPSRNQIAVDLIGHRLTEGYKDGWFSEDWHWDIKQGQIKALKIKEVLKNTNKDYCFG